MEPEGRIPGGSRFEAVKHRWRGGQNATCERKCRVTGLSGDSISRRRSRAGHRVGEFEDVVQLRGGGITIVPVEYDTTRAAEMVGRGCVFEFGENRFAETGKERLAARDVQRAHRGG